MLIRSGFLTIQPMDPDFIPLQRFWQPRFWPGWLVVAFLRLIVMLPQPVRMACGRGLGRLAGKLLDSRREIAITNLRICFPELSETEIAKLTRKHFESLGMGVVEVGMAWWCSDRELAKLITVAGIEHVQAALDEGKGVLMLSAHFAITELSGRATQPFLPPMAAMYRPSDNPMNDQIMRRCRARSTEKLVTKTGIRTLLKLLKNNYPFWYAADQAFEGKSAELIKFFDEPAMTNTAISQIARVSGAQVIPLLPSRLENGKAYEVKFLPALNNFPSGDSAADALRINQLLEEHIRKIPEQYYWVHRRFKGRPDNYPNPYKLVP